MDYCAQPRVHYRQTMHDPPKLAIAKLSYLPEIACLLVMQINLVYLCFHLET